MACRAQPTRSPTLYLQLHRRHEQGSQRGAGRADLEYSHMAKGGG